MRKGTVARRRDLNQTARLLTFMRLKLIIAALAFAASLGAQYIPPAGVGPTGPTGATGTVSATTFVNGLPLTGASFPAARSYATASGDVDVYTAPSLKRALVLSAGGYNTTGGTLNWFPQIKSGGNYYRMATSAAVVLHNSAANTPVGIVLEPGESISVNTDGVGMNYTFSVIQFDSTSPLRTAKLLGPATGNNTLYTVPAAKTAWVLGGTGLTWNVTSALTFVSDAGGTRAFLMCSVASGGVTTCAADSANEINKGSSAASTRTSAISVPMTLNTADFVVVNVDTGAATQIVWINVLEF